MAIDMFLKFTGPGSNAYLGESLDPTHPDEHDVLAYSWGLSNTVTVGGGGVSRVSPQDLSVTIYQSRATIALMQACCAGAHLNATLTFRKPGPTPLEFLKIDLVDVVITSQQMGGSGGEDRLTENYSLHMNKIKFTNVYAPPGGGAPVTRVGGWDFPANIKFP